MSEVEAAIGTVLTDITSQATVGNVITVVTVGLSVAVGFVLMWFGVRKLIKIINGAMKNGRLSVWSNKEHLPESLW